jgi:imidazolonepropionase-like amidohydrolase
MEAVVRNSEFALGTDMWALPGIAVHLELEYMVQAGMRPGTALVAATNNAAIFFGKGKRKKKYKNFQVWKKQARGYDLGEIGTIDPGKQADLLILDANPLEDIRNTRSVRTIIKHGVVFDHQQLIEESKNMK